MNDEKAKICKESFVPCFSVQNIRLNRMYTITKSDVMVPLHFEALWKDFDFSSLFYLMTLTQLLRWVTNMVLRLNS
jgi:hypothetical protein